MTYPYGMVQAVLFNSVSEMMASIPPVSRETPSRLNSGGHGIMQLYDFGVLFASILCVSHNISQATSPRSARGLLPYEILEIVDRELSLPRFVTEGKQENISTIRTLLNDKDGSD